MTDNRTIFEYLNKNSKVESKNTLIQFRFSCINLGIQLNTTSVSTYKSLIERGNGTFGRRVPQELRSRKIKTIEKANEFIKEYLIEINSKFSRYYEGINVFRPSPNHEILCNKISVVTRRTFDKACCVKYKNEFYQATINGKFISFKEKTKCLVVNTFDGRMLISVDSVSYLAKNIKCFKNKYNKQINPDRFTCLNELKVSEFEFVKYNLKNKSIWSFTSFNRYVEKK